MTKNMFHDSTMKEGFWKRDLGDFFSKIRTLNSGESLTNHV
jgi:hypothetical protein